MDTDIHVLLRFFGCNTRTICLIFFSYFIQVAKLVRACRESNENANPLIENKSEAKKTDVPSSQTKSEKDKTDNANAR